MQTPLQTPPIGVLVMAYGTPRSLEEVEAYYTHIRRGRAPSPELLQNLIDRYQAIGGVSPLNEITRAQAEGIEERLNKSNQGSFKVYLGMKHNAPFIADAVADMAQDGVSHAVTLVLAPHYSTMSVANYQKAANEKATELGHPDFVHVDSWHLEPKFIELLSDRVAEALKLFPSKDAVRVLFTAHSLPERILQVGDPYPTQLRETGDAVAAALGLTNYSFGWQSAGRTEEKWLGPDVLDVLRELHEAGENDVVICPTGFVSDHLEVLYDVDIECQGLAKSLGMHLERTASLNADPRFLDLLSDVVLNRAKDIPGIGQ
ncbi:ferrochelatase [Alicyclobacillus ferrooxydans]|uniref:Coproporphyrin III ferrochelatase n=1 Tax=Alicyclobacillus ferrooxydans TaxID=471514 RepID=A0A0P9GP25_9BACL|nr:ferrochelatase [Alicyclobacillus ferrooxydans]KPV42335.1 ferrochelatase [Alicyclobacillus ferrooxydans]